MPNFTPPSNRFAIPEPWNAVTTPDAGVGAGVGSPKPPTGHIEKRLDGHDRGISAWQEGQTNALNVRGIGADSAGAAWTAVERRMLNNVHAMLAAMQRAANGQ